MGGVFLEGVCFKGKPSKNRSHFGGPTLKDCFKDKPKESLFFFFFGGGVRPNKAAFSGEAKGEPTHLGSAEKDRPEIGVLR